MTRRSWVLAVVMVFALSFTASAQRNKDRDQGNTRSVQGTVSDANETPVEQAVVQLKDTKTLQVRSFITKADGSYHFHGLNPDVDYELKAEQGGAASGSKTLSAFDSRKAAVINLKLQPRK